MNILQLIMTHKEALPTVKRHLPIWENISKNIIFVSPKNSYMEEGRFVFGYPEARIGDAEHSGELSRQRIVEIFEYAISLEWDYLLLLEYDAFALALPKEVIPEKEGVSAIKYKQNKPIKYKASFYLHYPMLFTREGLKKTYWKLSDVKTNDRFFSDRFIGRAVELARIPVKDLLKMKKGYSKNTIEPKHYQKLKQAVAEGAIFFHGVKNTETLSHIIK